MALPDWVVTLLSRAGLTPVQAQPLTGGVSSEVWRVRLSSGESVVVKRAVERLRVQAQWVVPLERNTFEARYLAAAATIVPAFAPQIVVADDDLHAFAMTDLGPIPSWRDDLAAGRVDADVGAVLGDRLAAIHAQTAGNDSTAREFASDHLFEALRIEPYLRYSAVRSPAHAAALSELAHDLADTHRARPRRRQPKEHHRDPRRTGAHRCRMRLVRRSRLRSRVLPQSSTAQADMEATAPCATTGNEHSAAHRVLARRFLGAAKCGGRPHRAVAARVGARPYRRAFTRGLLVYRAT